MPVIELDPIDGPMRDSRSPVAILTNINAAMSAPTNVTAGLAVADRNWL